MLFFFLKCLFLGGVMAGVNTLSCQNDYDIESSNEFHLKKPNLAFSNEAIELSINTHFQKMGIEDFRTLYKTRKIAENYFDFKHFSNRLCYFSLKKEQLTLYQLVPYHTPVWFLNLFIFRKIYSVWQQTQVLYHTFFPIKQTQSRTKGIDIGQHPELTLIQTSKLKTGSGALCDSQVIKSQLIYPEKQLENAPMLVLYNYAPLKAGKNQLHFLIIPNPNQPAKDFTELEEEQFIHMMQLIQKIETWAQQKFDGKAMIHVFDKKGQFAGQTQPLYHAHVVIVDKKSEEFFGKINMLFRMLLPQTPLSKKELEKRVTLLKKTLGDYIQKNHLNK